MKIQKVKRKETKEQVEENIKKLEVAEESFKKNQLIAKEQIKLWKMGTKIYSGKTPYRKIREGIRKI